ncbi:AbrB family transcriptional regulator [Antarcticimicrobium luteum]|uniref:AbrB family transcriptional regulator n=1 Tax=Antarcticimicrobium luteum TaxID=2547397 RepID=A0A4R5V6G6_9RHOB|nr:AbrB family transcriptional regulator [Antarcticimicrobium luteum]TDK47494.1 AbrB family transcriptional regulator [Antarcticimicrobium luteum]
MTAAPLLAALWRNARTIAVGALGAGIAWALSVPAALLVGPALTVTLAGLAGMRCAISAPLMQVSFAVLGMGVGAGFTEQAGGAILQWPLAFAVLALAMPVTMALGRLILQHGFGFDRRSAVLAAAPGHLSFVLAAAADSGSDLARIAVVQSIRLLALTLIVPFAALALGYRMAASVLPPGVPMDTAHLIALAAIGVALGLVFRRLNLPAPILLGPMLASTLGHVTGLTPGTLPAWLMTPAFLVMGTLIGTRFSGMLPAQVRAALLAGLAVTLAGAGVAALAALPVALILGIPQAHVLTGFAPGGLETMLALGVAMGASPGFVAACHIIRLLVLSFLIPIALHRAGRQASAA